MGKDLQIKEPTRIVGLPPLHEFNEKNYLTAFLKYIQKFALNDQINFSFELGVADIYAEKRIYHFYMYELQNKAFDEVLTLISNYTVKGFHDHTRGATIDPDSFTYFQSLLDLFRIIENAKK